jgi:histidine triad (HIT) family protein
VDRKGVETGLSLAVRHGTTLSAVTVIGVTGCVFCDIVTGAKPAFQVATVECAVAFLDARPVFKGHLLVVPRTHLVTLADLPPSSLGDYFGFVQRLSIAVESGLGAGGTFVAINNKVSQSVPHLHTHVVPRTKGDGLRGFFWPRHKYASDEEAAEYAARIAAAYSST